MKYPYRTVEGRRFSGGQYNFARPFAAALAREQGRTVTVMQKDDAGLPPFVLYRVGPDGKNKGG